MPASCALIVEDLHKSFGTVNVLSGISLEIREGEVISLIGSSGSGKSTMLRCINFMELPTEGRIFFKNECLGREKTARNGQVAISYPESLLCRVRTKIGALLNSKGS